MQHQTFIPNIGTNQFFHNNSTTLVPIFTKRHFDKGKRQSNGYDMESFFDGYDLMYGNLLRITFYN